MKFKIKKKELEQIISSLSEEYVNESILDITDATVYEPSVEDNEKLISVEPKTDLQIADENMPIGDKNWLPSNKKELLLSTKQLVSEIPESQVLWFYQRLKGLVDKAISQEDQKYLQPRYNEY